MKSSEFLHLLCAAVVLTIVIGFKSALTQGFAVFAQALFFALLILVVSVACKKGMAYIFEMGAEHRLWSMSQWGLLKQNHLKTPLPTGIIFPLIASLFSLGTLKLMTLLTYETTARKTRAARSFGTYRYLSTTDWHNGLVGAAGITATLILAIVGYLINQESLAKFATFYAAANLIPFSTLDGTQIFFGSRVLYTALAVLTLIFFLYALLLV